MSEIMQDTADQKLFSIIIATHNCGEKIANTLDSIFSQNRELFEVIIFDNVSTDDTLHHINSYEQDLKVFSEKDDGVYFAFNKGIDIAKGKYIYFIGAGDTLKPGILDTVKEHLPRDEFPAFVYGRCYFVVHKTENGKEFDANLFIRDNLCQQGIFYHREIFSLIGKFDLRYKILSDWLFNLKCFLDDRIQRQYLDLVVADYEEGGLSSDIRNDPIFLAEFPKFVKSRLGFRSYLLCKAFLKEPYLFNYIYFLQFHRLPRYLAYRNKTSRNAVRYLKFYLSSFQRFWKGSSY